MKLRLPLICIGAMMAVVVIAGGMTPEARRSYDAFVQRVEKGDPEAMYRMSALLERGFDTIPADTLRSVELLRRSAEAGFAPAQNYLGYLYQSGNIIPENRDSAMYWIRKAADAGDAKASHNLAFLILENQHGDADATRRREDSVAANYLRRAADAGMPQAMTMLADLYLQGRGVEADTLQAVALYDEAIDHGFRDAELRLLNLMGPKWRLLSSQASLEQALKYWKKGAHVIASELLLQVGPEEPETARAYALLGHAYSRGLGLPYDHRKANEYFARAAMLGNPSAQFILAETLEIFPDALKDLLPEAANDDRLTPQSLRESAANAGISTPEQATSALLN